MTGTTDPAGGVWEQIYNANGDAYLYGYCAMSSLANEVWFAAEPGDVASAYLVLNDRECGNYHTSNTVNIP